MTHAALNRFGVVIELIHEAIELAVVGGLPLGIEQFATAFTDRTGCSAPMNPFITAGWAELDCTLVLADEPPVDTGWQPTPKTRRGRGRGNGGRP